MITQSTAVSGVILAGGLARRMNYQDKGLVLYRNAPLISYAISAMLPLVQTLLINANRSQADYCQFGFQVIADRTASFDGPLAGILAALWHCQTPLLLVMPCDAPLMQTQHLQRLIAKLGETNAEIAVACDGEKIQPVFLALQTRLKQSLENYLHSGERKLLTWIQQHRFEQVDFSGENAIFANLNSLAQLNALEEKTAEDNRFK
jgi:molybdenum cofactor guanylyltransferase